MSRSPRRRMGAVTGVASLVSYGVPQRCGRRCPWAARSSANPTDAPCRSSVRAAELLDVHAGNDVIAEDIDVKDTSFAE